MLLTIVFGVIGFGIIVFVHELGHFIAAKLSGIEVEVLSLGWGKRLVGFVRGGTWYQLSWFPVGGYCKMKGEESFKDALAADADDFPSEQGSFYAASPGKRMLVSAAGPAANLVFAIVVLTIIYWAGFIVYSDRNQIVLISDYTLDAGSAAAPGASAPNTVPAAVSSVAVSSAAVSSAATRAGLKTGDRVVAIDGLPVEKFQDILEAVATSPDERLVFTVQRNDGTLTIPIVPELNRETGAGRIGVYAWTDAVVEEVAAGSAAYLAGIEPGDHIVAIGDAEVAHTIDIFQALIERPAEVNVSFRRNGQLQSEVIVLHYDEQGAPDLGLAFKKYAFRSPNVSLLSAFVEGARETVETIGLTAKGIGLLFRGVNVGRAVAGPLRITYYVGVSAVSGLSRGLGAGAVSYFRFLCLLSVVIFFMNLLLPIPALDGPRMLLFALEQLRGKAVRPKIVYRMQLLSFYVLIVLVVVITLNDIFYFFER